jgi:adenine-specific DNA glycosylase
MSHVVEEAQVAVQLVTDLNSKTPRRGIYVRRHVKIASLPGIGQYVANAVLLFAHGRSEPLLDANVARVLERHFGPRRLAAYATIRTFRG